MGKSAKVSKKFIFIDSFSRHGMNSPLRNLDKMRKRGETSSRLVMIEKAIPNMPVALAVLLCVDQLDDC